MQERILMLASGIVGVGEAEQELLSALCMAAEAFWTARLKEGITVSMCQEAFCCAAAFSAAADFVTSHGSGVESFTAGEISVKTGSGSGSRDRADALRKSANRLMAPYAAAEEFCFKGVWG